MDDDEKNELEFLRFYHKNIQSALGPADADINFSVYDDWKDTGKPVPAGYDYRDED